MASSSCPASSFVCVGLVVLVAPSFWSAVLALAPFLVNVKVKLISCGLSSKSSQVKASQVKSFLVNVKWGKYKVKVKISLTHTHMNRLLSKSMSRPKYINLHNFVQVLPDNLQSSI